MTEFEKRVLQIIASSSGVKAKDIAHRIGCTRREVNSVLYSSLQNHCCVDADYKWYYRDEISGGGGENMGCKFLSQLSKLRKSSMESVENITSFDAFKKYLHVLRPVEEELRSLLSRVKATNKKTLILLCGSAGDGKSHLISYLKNADPALAALVTYCDEKEMPEFIRETLYAISQTIYPSNHEGSKENATTAIILEEADEG